MQPKTIGRIKDIIEACENIQKCCVGMNEETLEKDVIKFAATIRFLEIISEASKNIPEDIRIKHSKIPWKKMAGLRDILIHAYNNVDPEAVWKIATESVPTIKNELLKIITG